MQQELRPLWERQIFSVSQIINDVRFQLETRFNNVWVRGEISNFRVPPSGHFYFTLRDSDAQLKAVCFKLQNCYLKFRPEDGLDVIARGSLSVYPPRGEFQLVVEFMEPVGRGALQIAFEQLKARLENENLFDPARKRSLPLLPARIGVVTSPTGAAIQDILRVLERRNDRVDILIFPVKVQGPGAAQEIARAVEYLNSHKDIDVLIVARGGGTLEDLWAFNEEVVARAIYNSAIPVISAVGHQTDFTIADFVADLRAPTPSAAAEIVSAARSDLVSRIEHLTRRSTHGIKLVIQQMRRSLHQAASSRGFVHAESRLRHMLQRLDELQARLSKTVPVWIEPLRKSIARLERSANQCVRYILQHRRQLMNNQSEKLDAFSPLAVLQRGYAIVTNEARQVVRDPSQVPPGSRMTVQVATGVFTAKRETNGN
ncbi:MAG: exodeoxyribonuclease VII large subunit [Acidobacteria bacterium]|nr:exodeoxyribonuclease VII large subunit [Acidobacteriota bacterium]